MMPNNLERPGWATPNSGLAAAEHRTLMRIADVQAEGLVQTEKVHELDRVTREAMTGHAFLRGWASQVAGNDPVRADELRFFTDTTRLGKAEIIADTLASFRRK